MAVAAVIGLVTSCSPEDPEAPTQIVITAPDADGEKRVVLVLTPTTVPADGVSVIKITALCTVDGNMAPNGLPVEFKTTNGDLSVNGIDPISGGDNNNFATGRTSSGEVTLFLIAPLSIGNAEIEANFINEAVDTGLVTFTAPANRVANVALALSPSSGQSPLTTTATATVTDEDGNALEGITVAFYADTRVKLSQRRVDTDSNGQAVVIIDNVTEDTIVTAETQGRSATATINITNDTATGITLAAVNYTTDPILLNDSGTLLLRATITGDSGSVEGVRVQFSSTDDSTTFDPRQDKTNTNGQVETFARGINSDSTITATADGLSDSISIKINSRPVPVINLVSGTATAGQVAQLTFSGENSFDPNEPYGDFITSYTWGYTLESPLDVPVSTANTGNAQRITYTVGEAGGVLPQAGDKLTVFLTVVDNNNLQATAQYEIFFN